MESRSAVAAGSRTAATCQKYRFCRRRLCRKAPRFPGLLPPPSPPPPSVYGVDVSHAPHSQAGLRTLRGFTCECVRRVCVCVSVCECVCAVVAGGRVCACSGGVVVEMVLWVARGSVGEAATPSPSPTTPAPRPHSAPHSLAASVSVPAGEQPDQEGLWVEWQRRPCLAAAATGRRRSRPHEAGRAG